MIYRIIIPSSKHAGRVSSDWFGLLLWVYFILISQTMTAYAQTRSIYTLPSDPTLKRLISESLAARPEIVEGEALVRAQAERAEQVGSWPDPMIQVGIQNDGFSDIEIGKMGTSYVSIMASQSFPWPGKLGLREEIADLGAGQNKKSVERLRLSTEAEVRRSYLALVLARDRLVLLDRLANLWERSAAVARAVYESGGGAQSDLLRAQLEIGRLKVRRLGLVAEDRTSTQRLNRLRGHMLDEPITTTVHLDDLGLPVAIAEKAAVDDALTRSPELAASRLGLNAAEKSVDLANKSYYPDLVLTAGIMPRGGDFPPMWSLAVGATIPVFAGSNQNRYVDENEARSVASRANIDVVEQIVRLRVHERLTALSTLSDTVQIYRDGLLIESEANTESALAQYQVGKASFASVLDANAGYLTDEEAYLQAIADAHRIAISAFEIALDPVAGYGDIAAANSPMPGQGAGSTGLSESSKKGM
jgi:outer membrane protein, heavy metal efflux system